MSLLQSIGQWFDRQANAVVDAGAHHINPEMQRYREEKIRAYVMLKIASVVAVACAILFTALFPSTFSFLVLGLTAFCSYETYTASSNILEVIRNARIALISQWTKGSLIHQIAKNTLILGPILELLDPSFEDLFALTRWTPRS